MKYQYLEDILPAPTYIGNSRQKRNLGWKLDDVYSDSLENDVLALKHRENLHTFTEIDMKHGVMEEIVRTIVQEMHQPHETMGKVLDGLNAGIDRASAIILFPFRAARVQDGYFRILQKTRDTAREFFRSAIRPGRYSKATVMEALYTYAYINRLIR